MELTTIGDWLFLLIGVVGACLLFAGVMLWVSDDTPGIKHSSHQLEVRKQKRCALAIRMLNWGAVLVAISLMFLGLKYVPLTTGIAGGVLCLFSAVTIFYFANHGKVGEESILSGAAERNLKHLGIYGAVLLLLGLLVWL